MDRRQRKTREAIFGAFMELLSKKDVSRITVGEIIEKADVGRATFYAHFETKDYLIKALCEDLFCHIFDRPGSDHRHLFTCEGDGSVFLHLFRHLMQNDNHLLDLLSSENSELFLNWFKASLKDTVRRELPLFSGEKREKLPEEFFISHVSAVFVNTLLWWVRTDRNESPEQLNEYFMLAVQ